MIEDGQEGWTFLPAGSPDRSAEGPALVVALEAGDAVGRAAMGSAGILRALGHGVLTASMSVDEWTDPHRHPPLADVEQGLLCAVAWPALEVRPGTDRHGRPWALVHGPVPTSGWRAFAEALARLAAALRARAVVTLASVPAPPGPAHADEHVGVVGAATESALLAGVDRLDPATTPPTGPEIAVAGALAHRGIPALAAFAVVAGHGETGRHERACPQASADLVATAAYVLGLDLEVPASDCPEGGREAVGAPGRRASDELADEVEHFLRASGRGGTHQHHSGEDTP